MPEDSIEKVLYYLCVILKCTVRLGVTLECSAYVVPAALYEFDKNPDQPIKERSSDGKILRDKTSKYALLTAT